MFFLIIHRVTPSLLIQSSIQAPPLPPSGDDTSNVSYPPMYSYFAPSYLWVGAGGNSSSIRGQLLHFKFLICSSLGSVSISSLPFQFLFLYQAFPFKIIGLFSHFKLLNFWFPLPLCLHSFSPNLPLSLHPFPANSLKSCIQSLFHFLNSFQLQSKISLNLL